MKFTSLFVALVFYVFWYVYATKDHMIDSDGRMVIDLTHDFNGDTIYWVTTKPLFMNVTHNGTFPGPGYWYQMEDISAGTHGGTHIDAPCHYYRGRWCVSDIPLKQLIAPAVVVDISHHVGSNSSVHLEPKHLISWEEQHEKIPDGSVLMIRTGWARFWPHRSTYTGTETRDPNLVNYPALKPETAEWLDKNRNIVGLGIDSLSVEMPRSNNQTVHIIMGSRNIYNIENVNDNLKLLPPTGTILHVMPMKLTGASGAPSRIVAIVNSGSCHGAERAL